MSRTPTFDHTTESGEQGDVKVELCDKVAELARSFHRFTGSLRLALMFVFPPRKVTEDMPSSSEKKQRCVEY